MSPNAKDQLSAFLQESGKSQKQVSKEIGLSSAVISQFLAGSYTGNNIDVAGKILRYLEVGKIRLNRVQAPDFCASLNNAKQVGFAASYAHKNNEMALVYGDAGAGKTMALRHYAETNPGVLFITANACCKSSRAILYLISEALGGVPTGSQFVVMRALVDMLKGSNRLLIVDEADHLTLSALQAIRNLYDEAGIGIVIAGNEQILEQMKGRGWVPFGQLRTRFTCIKKVANNYSADDMRLLFPDLDAASAKHLATVARSESLRTAVKRHTFAAQCANAEGQQCTIDYLTRAAAVQLESA